MSRQIDELLAVNKLLVEELENITDAYERALKRFGAHEWGMITIERCREALAKAKEGTS